LVDRSGNTHRFDMAAFGARVQATVIAVASRVVSAFMNSVSSVLKIFIFFPGVAMLSRLAS